jgi:hypothetical protein
MNKIQGFDECLSKHFFYILKDTQSREKHNKGVTCVTSGAGTLYPFGWLEIKFKCSFIL